jgi:uncharacterized sporulation protein YeaH/YhbH (DUF444 family)
VEEKFFHQMDFQPEEGAVGGTGEGQEGEVIGEQPLHDPAGPGAGGPGEGSGEAHELEASAYDLGRILTEKFKLPNLKEKGKKRSLTRYTYDLTDTNCGFGQFLDKKRTLRKILETNIGLGRISAQSEIDTSSLLVSPEDMVFRVLSQEKDYEAQAMVFFLRDYSGSMDGRPTDIVVAQHVMIYSWLLYQYSRQVETRFILHDTEAREVDDFYTYYNLRVAGGTKVASAYRLVNEIVEKENLIQDYNIYVFHGTDGEDWDSSGREAIPAVKTMLSYTNRVGITIAEYQPGYTRKSSVQLYMEDSGLLRERPQAIRLDVIQEDADDNRLIEGIRKLISE